MGCPARKMSANFQLRTLGLRDHLHVFERALIAKDGLEKRLGDTLAVFVLLQEESFGTVAQKRKSQRAHWAFRHR